MKKIVCFGEIMGRLNPPGYLRFSQTNNLEITYAGGEANVAVSLAQFGLNSSYVTKLPSNKLASCVKQELNRYGVKTDDIVHGGQRLGLFFVEKGASQRPSEVIYDRKHSSISSAHPSDFNWAEILSGASWFHFTGITPALGEYLPEICLDALKEANRQGITVSCDLNYRSSLWTREQAEKTMTELMPYVDVLIANEEDANDVFRISADGTDVAQGKLNKDGYKKVASKLQKRFNLKIVGISMRTSLSANDNLWSGMLFDGKQFHFSKEYRIHIIDRIGGGDAFAAGIIMSILNTYPYKRAIEFAAAASCLKHSIEHDFNLVTIDEVERLLQGDESGRIKR